jgi:tRNA threonylcarbamoyladenosine biosynthesis protein TsaE
MEEKSLVISSLGLIDKAAGEFLKIAGKHNKFAFYGPVGAGKTTFIKAICKKLGAGDIVTSPTFALVNEYVAGYNEKFYHFDFYRIESVEEIYDIGYEELFYSDSYCFIEWPEKAEMLLPAGVVRVYMTDTGDNTRHVRITF